MPQQMSTVQMTHGVHVTGQILSLQIETELIVEGENKISDPNSKNGLNGSDWVIRTNTTSMVSSWRRLQQKIKQGRKEKS